MPRRPPFRWPGGGLARCAVLEMDPPAAQASPAPPATRTRQDPAAHPPALDQAATAHNAATGTAVLFGGLGGINQPVAQSCASGRVGDLERRYQR
jgi:hypothetical protein